MNLLQYTVDLPSTTVLFICTIFATVCYAWIYIKSRKSTSNLPPGPKGLPLVGNLLSLDPELHSYFADLAQTYGPIFKLKLGTKLAIVISSPSTAREVLKDHDITFANRDVPIVGRLGTYGGSDIVWTPYGPQWRMLRKVCVLKMLNNTILDSVYEQRRSEIRHMVRYVYDRVGSPIRLGEQISLTTINVVINMLWGGSVRGDERASLAADFRRVMSGFIDLLGVPNVSDFYPGLAWFDLQGLQKKTKALAGELDRIYEGVIAKRLKLDGDSGNDTKDFLQFLLQLKDEEDSKTPLTRTHVKALLTDMVAGGSDTSSHTIEFTMAELLKNPEIMKNAQEELDAVVGQGNIVEEAHIHNLSYLQAVMKESFRCHPTLPLLVPHSPSETCTVGGYTVPKGSRIFVNAWAIHRDPTIWKNPLEFIPERFLNGNFDLNGNDLSYIPFGSGKRICVGIRMAERMVLFTLATLLHSFDWKLPEGQKMDCSEKFGIVLKLKTPLVAIAVPRLHDPELYK